MSNVLGDGGLIETYSAPLLLRGIFRGDVSTVRRRQRQYVDVDSDSKCPGSTRSGSTVRVLEAAPVWTANLHANRVTLPFYVPTRGVRRVGFGNRDGRDRHGPASRRFSPKVGPARLVGLPEVRNLGCRPCGLFSNIAQIFS